jgi:hemerythrin superfamily protein
VTVKPKNKDINRWRPLVSYFHNYAKKCGKLIARALTIFIKSLENYWKTMNLSKVDDFKQIINEMNKHDKWKKKIKADEITIVSFDLKEQFTNLNKSEVISITKRKIDKYRDSVGKKGNDFHVFDLWEVSSRHNWPR